MRKGKVKFFNQKSGFGFIIDEETKEEFYVHEKETHEQLESGDQVLFSLKEMKRGPVATAVKKISE